MASNDDVSVKFGATTDALNAGVDQAKGKLGEVAEAAEDLKSGLEGIATVIGEVFAVDKLADFSSEMANIGLQIENMTHLTGQSTDQVQNFQDSIQILGGDVETAGTTLVRLERNMSDAAAGIGNSAQAFDRLGVSAKTLASGNVNEVWAEMADRMHATADGANKTGAAMEAGGRGAYTLIPILDQGREGFETLSKAIDAVKVKLDPGMTEAFAESAVGINLLKLSIEGTHEAFFSQMEPGIDAAVAGLTQFSAQAAQATKAGNSFAEAAKLIGAVADGVTAAVLGIATAFEGLLNATKAALFAIVDVWSGAFQAIKDITSGSFKQAITDYDSGLQKADDDTKAQLDKSASLWQNYYDTLKRMMDVYSGSASVSPIKLGSTQGKGSIGGPTQNDKGDDSDKYRQLQQEKYEVTKSFDDLEAQSGRMSHQQELADLQATLAFEQALVDQSFEAQMAQYATDSAQYKKLQDEKIMADQKFTIEHNKLILDAGKQEMKIWNQVASTVEKNLDSMIKGVMSGTQTMTQAFQKLAQNMIFSLEEALVKMLGDWIKTELQKTAATQAGNLQRTASDQAAANSSSMANKSAASEQIAQDAYESAANVYADVSAIPYVGWILAPPAAAAAFGAVMAFDSFDKGTDYVPHDMVAQIHKGERILTADENKAISGSAGGGKGAGGDTHNYFINAMDAKSFHSFLNRNKGALQSAIAASQRNGIGRAATVRS